MVEKKEVKKEVKKAVKAKRVVKTISQLVGKLGWICFTTKQLIALGINPEKQTTSDLRKIVFGKLGLGK